MSDVAAFLVVLDKHVHPELAEATIAAAQQLKGVIGVRTLYDDAGREIEATRGIVERLRDNLYHDRLSNARDAARDGGAVG